MDPDFEALIPSKFVPWLVTHFTCDNIDENKSNLDGENISQSTHWTDEFEIINKPKPSYRFHMWCPSCRRCKSSFWLEGFRIKVMSVGGNGSVAKASVQNMAGFIVFKWQGKMTIIKAGQSTKTTILTSHTTWQGLALSSLHLHMIWITEHCCGLCLISSNTVMWNIFDGERSTWIKFIKFHKKSRQSLGQQICCKALFTSIQSVRPRSEIWMAWVHWYRRRMFNLTPPQELA